MQESEEKVQTVMNQYRRGLITNEERYDRIISIWSEAKDEITEHPDEVAGPIQLRST